MKTVNTILSILSAVLSVAALICLIVENLDAIMEALERLRIKVDIMRAKPCYMDACADTLEEDDFEDWDA